MMGFITMAYGHDKYFDQATTLARSLRLHMPGLPLAVVSDRSAVAGFDQTIPIRPFTTAGTLHKIDLYDYTPFHETLFIDSDCIVTRPFQPQLRQISVFDFSPVVARYLQPGDTDAFLESVGKALSGVAATRFPKFNGGVYFFRKSAGAAAVFRLSRDLLARQEELGIKNFDRAGPGDETLIGLALASLGLDSATMLYDDGGLLMRTPLNRTGRLIVDPYRARSRFVKEGQVVSPAIVHFCGDYVRHPTYLVASKELETGKRLPMTGRARIHGKHWYSKISRRLSTGFAVSTE